MLYALCLVVGVIAIAVVALGITILMNWILDA